MKTPEKLGNSGVAVGRATDSISGCRPWACTLGEKLGNSLRSGSRIVAPFSGDSSQ